MAFPNELAALRFNSPEDLVEIILTASQDLSNHYNEQVSSQAERLNSRSKYKNDELEGQILHLQRELASAKMRSQSIIPSSHIQQVLISV